MLTRGQSGFLEVLLEVLNADFLQLRGGQNILQRSGTGTWEMYRYYSFISHVGFNILLSAYILDETTTLDCFSKQNSWKAN